jgi:hypothetical protein
VLSAAAVCPTRAFAADDKTYEEAFTKQGKMRDVQIVAGAPRPTEREGDWACAYRLDAKMADIVPRILEDAGWAQAEITRECRELFAARTGGKVAGNFTNWDTVDDFQRTPWYRRYRPNDGSGMHFVSIDCMQLLEVNLIAPSNRKDPYSHLRKRHYEDSMFNERFSEDSARHLTRAELAKMTPGMPQHGQMSRKKFMEFDTEYKKHGGRNRHPNACYHAFRSSQGATNSSHE